MDTTAINTEPGRVDIQSTFLNSIRNLLPTHLSLPDELAELLNISRDSAYRRIRRETILSLDEVRILCSRYNVSLDTLMEKTSGRVSFEPKAKYGPGISLKSWLESIYSCLKMIEAAPGGNMVWHSKELPIFHYFRHPRLSAFKFYWWINLLSGESSHEKYNEEFVGLDLIRLGERTWDLYSRLSSTEIISSGMISTTLRQIEYAYESGLLSRELAVNLCQDCSDMISEVNRQASEGIKSDDHTRQPGKVAFYINDLLIGDNTLLFQADDKQVVFVTYNNFNIMSTNNDSFCRETEHFMKAMIRKGILISQVAERERSKLFNKLHQQIDDTRVLLKAG